MLHIAAEFADRWNTHGEEKTSLAETLKTLESRLQHFNEICDKIGRKPDEVLKSVLTWGVFESDIFVSQGTFEETTNKFREIGVQEIIYYYPFWNEERKKVFDGIDSDFLSSFR